MTLDLGTLRALMKEEVAGGVQAFLESSPQMKSIMDMSERHQNKIAEHDASLAKLTKETESNSKQIEEMKATLSARSSVSGGPSTSSAGGGFPQALPPPRDFAASFVPRFFTIKNFCDWEERMEKGATDDTIEQWTTTLRNLLPENLKEQVGGWESRSFRSTRFNIWTKNPKATLDVMWFVIRQIGKAKASGAAGPVQNLQINGVWPQVTSERSPEDAPRLQAMGELLGGTRKALEQGGWLANQFAIAPDWKANKIKINISEGNRELLLVTLAPTTLMPQWEQNALQELQLTSDAILSASRR